MKYTSRNFAAIPLIAASLAIGALGGCAGDKKSDTLAQDSTLSSDMALANRDSAAQPQLQDVPITTTPAPAPAATVTRPTPAPAAPVRRTPTRTTPRPSTSTSNSANTDRTPSRTSSGNTVTRTPGTGASQLGTIAAGSTINLTSDSRVCTNTNHVGDRVSARVSQSVTGSNGAVIPAGATASLEITELKRSENARDNIVMGFRIRSITFGGKTYPVDATVNYAQVDRVKNQPGGKDAQKVATGAAIGAVLGQVLGKNTKSTVIGGAIGAAAGAGAAATTSNYEGCVPDGGRITVALDNSLQVQA